MRWSPTIGLLLVLPALSAAMGRFLYDSDTCGLPNSRSKRSAEIEYDDDYKSDDNKAGAVGDSNDPMRQKVMGGEDAQSGELPWAVLIELNMEGKVCGGTLVTRRHVITAAHCFWNGDDTPCKMSHAFREADIKKFTTIMIGGVCSKEDSKTHCEGHDVGTRYKIRNLYYESFFKTGCNSTQDFAIIELLEEVPKYIHHACLPHLHNIDMLDQRTAKFFTQGWGLNPPKGYEEIASPRLQKVDLGVKMTEDECRAEESGKKPDTFCTTEKSDVNVCHHELHDPPVETALCCLEPSVFRSPCWKERPNIVLLEGYSAQRRRTLTLINI